MYIHVLIVMLLLYITCRKTIKINIISSLVVLRGILAQSRFWWSVQDILLNDTNGNKLYLEYKHDNKDFVPINLFGVRMYIVYKPSHIKYILDNSPDIFGVGVLKKEFFKSFMKDNVGVSDANNWPRRRFINEKVLQPGHLHALSSLFMTIIEKSFVGQYPSNFDEFSILGKHISSKIVYNDVALEENFQVFQYANSLTPFIVSNYDIPSSIMRVYKEYNMKHAIHPYPNSLISLAPMTTPYELYQQIPHWLFPINGMISVALPRLIVILLNDKTSMCRLLDEIYATDTTNPIAIHNDMIYMRHCILELLRLMNPVNSSFRTLEKDYAEFKQGDQFVIFNNGTMRDPDYFDEPNMFYPDRWTPELEQSDIAISFNHGPQECPGKDLILFLFKCCLIHFFTSVQYYNLTTNVNIDTKNVPQTINPYKIIFYTSKKCKKY